MYDHDANGSGRRSRMARNDAGPVLMSGAAYPAAPDRGHFRSGPTASGVYPDVETGDNSRGGIHPSEPHHHGHGRRKQHTANKARNSFRYGFSDAYQGYPGQSVGFAILTLTRLLFQLGLTLGLGFVLLAVWAAFFSADGNQHHLPLVAAILWGLAWASAAYACLAWWKFTNNASNRGSKEEESWDECAWRYALCDGVVAAAWIVLTILVVRCVWSPQRRFTFAVKPGVGNTRTDYGGGHDTTRSKDLHLNSDLWEPFDAWPEEQVRTLSHAFGLVFALCFFISGLFLSTALFYLFRVPAVVRSVRAALGAVCRACKAGGKDVRTRSGDWLCSS